MAISIDLIYTSVQEQIQKEFSSGYLSPSQFNSFCNQCNVELFNKYSVVYQDTQIVTDRILPFIKKNVLSVDEATGHMAYPSDYIRSIAIRAFEPDALAAAVAVCSTDPTQVVNYYGLPQIKVKVIDNNKLGDRLTSSIIKPDKYHPIATFYNSFVQYYPITIGSVIFEYLMQPTEVVWAYTLDANGLPVYDPINSIDFQWNWQMRDEIISRIIEYFSISVREQELTQGAELIKSNQAT